MDQLTNSSSRQSIAVSRLAVFDPEAAARKADDTRATPAPKSKRKAKGKADRDFPLWYHGASGRWCRTIRGTRHYFGTDKDAALNLWLEQKDDLLAGRTPRSKAGAQTLADLCNRFLTAKKMLLDSGELSPHTFADYKGTTDRLIAVFGKNRLVSDFASDDFEGLRRVISKTRGAVGLANAVRLTRIVFKYAHDAALIESPVRFGPMFQVKRETIRKAAAGKPARMFEAADIRRMLEAADDVMHCWILLGINCAFGQGDLSALSKSSLDLDGGWISFPRPKTGVNRRCHLWPETVAAVRKAIALRREPKDAADADAVFLTPHRNRMVRCTANYGHRDFVGVAFSRLLTELKLKRPGLSFYALRHTFRTIADETRDFPAIDLIMGHTDNTMGGRYRERIDDARLRAVADCVRAWLFPTKRCAK